ncbi:hypothetical protein BCR34DRAFT_278019 [Clohesyomyces aquaticus]|uniref:Uncharacterized protein n=1 Tax=Clohesyomyces aquaticus TaxID=1231657 RepID=A0A1Y1ZS43_9PLEO|nr:hypothetical protein BCR34DRAFT_278019 [Clohesyomyces aquaticus]
MNGRDQQISHTVSHSKERFFGPKLKEVKAYRREKRALKKQRAALSDTNTNDDEKHLNKPIDDAVDHGSFFLQSPYLAFHEPPRVLYTGSTKYHTPVVLIHSSLFWRTYRLQLGPSLAEPGVLDPRGVVCWRHNGGDKKALKDDDHKLKGYKVRTWRLWGETGKRYVHAVKAARKAGRKEGDPDILHYETEATTTTTNSKTLESGISVSDSVTTTKMPLTPARAEEVVYLTWASPFSRDPRRYYFQYSGLEFVWKGTGTVKETRTCGFWLKYNHLKLVARLPISQDSKAESESDMMEVCLGKYTSSVAKFKCGVLELYDGAIWRLLKEFCPGTVPDDFPIEDGNKKADVDSDRSEKVDEAALLEQQIQSVKRTRLYQVIVATAMCMILGEKQKRETIRKIIELLASEGGGAGN